MTLRVAAAVCIRFIKDSGDPHQVGSRSSQLCEGLHQRNGFRADSRRTLINQNDVSSGISQNYFVSTRRSAKANLFRIYLE